MSVDEGTAEIYDQFALGDEQVAVAFLEELAQGRPALELAIGTGRIALPLAARGIRIGGIDISPAMVAKLRANPRGDQISVTMGDYADVPVPGTYRLIYVVFNTLFNLLTQDDQVRCFKNVAAHLTDGVFVVEVCVFHSNRSSNSQYVEAEAIGVDHVRLDVARYDAATRILEENHVSSTSDGVRLDPMVTRYASPSEIDLMAHLADLRLKDRWAGWNRESFISGSTMHVSVFGR